MKNSGKTPGVIFITKKGTPFYVDILWAMVIENKKNLDMLLKLDQDLLNKKLQELSLHPLMRRYYSIANFFMHHSEKQKQGKSLIIDFYYHTLSPLLVPWQLKHPIWNSILRSLANFFAFVFMFLFRIPFLTPKETFEAKNQLIKYKSVHYDGMSNYAIKKFLHEESEE